MSIFSRICHPFRIEKIEGVTHMRFKPEGFRVVDKKPDIYDFHGGTFLQIEGSYLGEKISVEVRVDIPVLQEIRNRIAKYIKSKGVVG